MNKKDIYMECLLRGVTVIRPVGQREGSLRKAEKNLSPLERRQRLHIFTIARKNYNTIVAEGEREEAALNTVLFEATGYDFEEFERVIKAVNRTMKKFNSLN